MVKHRSSIDGLIPYAPGKPIESVQKEYGISRVVKLASNENPYGASPLAVEAAKKALEKVNFYPDGDCTDLREALAKKLNVSPGSLVFGAGEDEVISLIAQTFIDSGDEMITAQVTFGQYVGAVAAMGGMCVRIPMKNDGYDLEELLNAITPKTKMICISNPNNPTGTLISDKEKLEFLKRVPENILVLFDEAYQEFVESDSFSCSVPLVKGYANLVVLKTFSKIYGLASLRVGYAVMNESYAGYVNRIRKPFCVSIPAQMAALAALSDDNFKNETRRKNIEVKKYCYNMLAEMGLSFVDSEANFIAIDTGEKTALLSEELMKDGYIVRPNAFGMKDRLRVTIGTMEQMTGFFESFKKIIKR